MYLSLGIYTFWHSEWKRNSKKKKSCKWMATTNVIQQSPREAVSLSGGHEITCILWKSRFHNHSHKRSQLDPTLSQLRPLHTLTTYSEGLY
jgi:hypothetical protein